MYYHHKNHNILMIIICALRGTTNFTQALNGGHGQTQQTSPLIYLKIQVGGRYSYSLRREHHTVGYNPVFLATAKSIYKSCDSAITSAWLYF